MPQFYLQYDGQNIFVDGGEGSPYMLRFPNKRYLLLDCSADGWFIECGSKKLVKEFLDLTEIGKLINEGELKAQTGRDKLFEARQ